MLDINFIAFACYPPRPDATHDGGLVGLHFMSDKSHASSELLIHDHYRRGCS
jgi:hypothetical protein